MADGPFYTGENTSLKYDLQVLIEREPLSEAGKLFVKALQARAADGRFESDCAYLRPK